MARVVKPSPCSLHSLFPLHLQSYLTPEAGVEVEELPEDLVERGHLGGLIASSVWQGKTQITTKRLSLSSSHRIVMDNALSSPTTEPSTDDDDGPPIDSNDSGGFSFRRSLRVRRRHRLGNCLQG